MLVEAANAVRVSSLPSIFDPLQRRKPLARPEPGIAGRASSVGHHALDSEAFLGVVKSRRFDPTPHGAGGLDDASGRFALGTCVMANQSAHWRDRYHAAHIVRTGDVPETFIQRSWAPDDEALLQRHGPRTRMDIETTTITGSTTNHQPIEDPKPRLLSMRQAAAYLGFSFWTTRDYVLQGILPAVNMPPLRARHGERPRATLRRVLIDRGDLDAFIEQRKRRRKTTA